MTYREMAMDAGARGEDEIRQMAEMIEADHMHSMYDASAWAAQAEAQAEAEAAEESEK